MEGVRQQGGMFVEAVRVTRMPMLVTDAKLPGNPIIFANRAFIELSGYSHNELLGQDPHFMNGRKGLIQVQSVGIQRRSVRVVTRPLNSFSIARTARPSGRCCSRAHLTTAKGE